MKKLVLVLILLTGCENDIRMIPVMEVNSKEEVYYYEWIRHNQQREEEAWTKM